MKRRSFLPAAGAAVLAPQAFSALQAAPLKGNLKQGACRWCYDKIPIDDFAKACAEAGLKNIDLARKQDWPAITKYGLRPTMVPGPTTISDGLNRKENHAQIAARMKPMIEDAKAVGAPDIIVFSGNRKGMSDDEGLDNCVAGIRQLLPMAEATGVRIVMELLNSKVNHKDYMCDKSVWGVELARQVNSPMFGLLYDIYHMQIMEGDVIRTIKENHKYYFHYHTGGNPGRNEIDETQELNYPAIARAILETGYTGYFSHEFIPKRDPITSLNEATRLCDV
ncbi:MAG: TIM barrel protein [Bryobacterales bacterium]|nr:TIM barrel protein [Bryobacterales bacterium]